MQSDPILKNLLVVELASVLAGPAVGMFLAELGARVIKVENPRSSGDLTRQWKLPSEDPASDISSYFACVNWGKESIALDLSVPSERDLLLRIVNRADILLSSYRVGDAERLGVDHQTLAKLNPRLIYAHVTAFGPENSDPGFDAAIQAEAGFMFMNGEPGGDPVKMPVALVDLLTAHQVKEGILLALLRRERSGVGGYVTASLIQSAISSLANQATNWLIGGKIPQRTGSEHPNIAPYGSVYSCKDGKPIVLAVGSDRQFESLCAALEIEDLAADRRFRNNFDRVKNRDALNAELEPAIKRWSRAEITKRFREYEVPAASINNMQEVFELPAAGALILNAQADKLRGVRSAVFEISGASPSAMLARPPHLNEHGCAIWQEFENNHENRQ